MMGPNEGVAPIVLPLMTGALLLLFARRAPVLARWLSVASTAALWLLCVQLLRQADEGALQVVLLGNWKAPFGISLVLDRLAALMLLLASTVGLLTLLYASGGDDRRGAHFHALFQFQLMGLNGAFLTADLFNLFVFFELLLIASYGLLLHGGGAARLKASIHYVSFNLAGSALFLIALGLLYGLAGTLNMADLAQRLPTLGADRVPLVHSAALLLLVVFCVKAALLPLNFWMQDTYGAASAPVAALFAIMTKVGIYAVLRVTTLIFGPSAGPLADVAAPWLAVLALATLALGAVGALAAQQLRGVVVACIVASAGTLLLSVALAQPDTLAAGLFYLVDSTLAAAAMFLLADRVAHERGTVADGLQPAALGSHRVALGALFFVLAVALAGLPPLGGFLGKVWLLQAAADTTIAPWVVGIVLASALLVMVALVRGGSTIFWKPSHVGGGPAVEPASRPTPPHLLHRLSLLMLMLLLFALSVFAGPLARYTEATAQQLLEPRLYREAVFNAEPVPPAFDVRREMRARREPEAVR
jgi:multicomponent K+:H+ antiporter subunit D